MKTTTKHILTLALTLFCALGTAYAIDQTYYTSIDGKSGSTLRDALYTLTAKGPTGMSYDGLWTAYKTTDVYPSDSTGKAGKIWDMYSNVLFTAGTNQCGTYSNVGDCYNREHSLPKSWFNDAKPAYYDLGHIVPTDGKVNGQRSNYPFGECASGTRLTNGTKKGLGKLGTSTFSGYTNMGKVFEPDDIYKGDFARMYMYMAVRYKKGNSNNVNLAADSDGQKMFNSTDANFGFTDYSVALLMKWHRQDPVSVKEVLRNNGMEKVQGNRNPFIDYPDLAEYLWGNNQNKSVDLSSLTIATGGSSSIPTLYDVILNRNGVTETISTSGKYYLPTDEDAACDGWSFAGWSTNSSINTTTAPSFTTFILSAATLYAVYSNTSPSSAPIRRTPAAVGTTMWAETWTGATTATSGSNNATPSANHGKGTTVYNSGTVTYTQSANTVYVRNENTGGGTAPELLLSSGKTWTISNIPTGEATELTLTYKSNNTKSSVTCSTTGASITGSSKSYTITTGGASTITLEFGCSGNTRIDDVSLTVKTAGSGSGSGGSTTTYKTTPDCGSAHTITLSNSGSVTGGTFDASATSAYNGATITLYADPSDGYTFSSWTVTKADGDTVTVNDNQFTMPDANVTVSATFTENPKYTIRFYNNGSVISTQSVYENSEPDVPSDPEACEGYEFVGWYMSQLAANNTTEEDWITDFTVTGAQDYYAVYSHIETSEGNGSVTWTQVTNVSMGDEVVIAQVDDGTKEMTGFNTTTTTANNYGIGTTFSTNPAGTMVWTVESGNDTGLFSFKNGDYYLNLASNSNYLNGSTKKDANSSWTISTSSSRAVVSNASQTARKIMWNKSNTRFATYNKNHGNNSGQYYYHIVFYKKSGGSTSTTYYTSSPECITPCTNTPTMLFANTNVELTTDDATYTQAVTISNKGAGQTVTYSSSDETVATVSASGVVTLLGKIGSTTITASVAEDGDYCEASASYTLTVTKAPCLLTGISLNTEDVSLIYTTRDVFSADDLIVTADYSNCASSTVTPTSISSPDMSIAGTKTITVSYTENGVTKTANFEIEVSDPVTYTVTWSVEGIETAVVYNEDDYLILPSTPADCEGANGKKFVGWTASSSVDGSAPADLFTTASGIVTADVTYYAVFATASSGSGNGSDSWDLCSELSSITQGKYVITWDNSYYLPSETTAKSNPAVGSGITQSDNALTNTVSSAMQWTFTGDNTNGFTISHTSGSTTYYLVSTNAAQGIAVSTSSTDIKWKASIDGTYGMLLRGSDGGTRNLAVYNSGSWRYYATGSSYSGTLRLYKKVSSGATTYSNYSLVCDELCALTSITLNTDHVTKAFTTGDTFTSAGLVVTANYSNCASATVTPASISSPDMTSVGTKTITVSYTENGTTKTATYSITVNAPVSYTIRFFNNGSQIGSDQTVYEGSLPVVPTNPKACEGYAFVGWWTEAIAEETTIAQTWVTDFTVSKAQDYYAVFSSTESSSGDVSSSNESVTFSDRYNTNTSLNQTTIAIGTHVSVIFNKGSSSNAPQYYTTGSAIRVYGGGTCVVSTDAGNITAITLTFGTGDGSNDITANVGTYNAGSWSGEASSVTFSIQGSSGHRRIAAIAVTISGGSGSTTYYTSSPVCVTPCTKLETPVVAAVAGNEQITLTWADVEGAEHYTVTIGTGIGYTTECGSAASIGTITNSNEINTCIITGLTNGLAYTTTVVANASSSTCDSEADSDTATPQECTQWDDPALGWNKYSLNTTTANTATVTLSGTTHGTLSFESSNTDVLTVDGSTGTVTAQGAGEATVTAHWTAADGYCEKTITSQAFEVAGPLTINFDANGGTGTMTDQKVTYKVSTAIKDNSFTRPGYTFHGWALTADGEKVYDDKQSVAFTNSQTLYAVWMLNSHNVTFTPAPTGATVKVNNSSTSPVNNVNYGSTVTIAITPAEHYTVSALTVSGASGSVAVSGTGDTRTFTMPDEDVTVALTMEAESQYTATFHNGTATFATVDGYVDDDINAPTGTPSSCDDETFTFVGWVAAEQTTETTTMPEVVSFPQNMLSGGVDYYALFRRTEGGGGGEASVTFKTASSDSGSECTTDNDIKTNIVNTYTGIASFEGSKVYLGKSGVKLGNGSYSGSITLNLSSPITTDKITVEAVKYGTDGGNLKIEINGSTAFGSELSPADGTLNFTDNEVEISSLTILTTVKRAYVASISLGGGGTSYYTTAPECAVCESQVTITKGAETNGTFTLSKADGTYDNCKKNVSVIVSNITPADGYYCTGVTATGNPLHMAVSGPDDSGNYTVAYAKNYSFTSTITANFEEIPTYTVTWSVLGGEEISSATYQEGAAIAFPADPTGCEGKVFVGWTTEPILLTDEEPTLVTSATMGTEDITFYAVFATATTSGGGSETELLNEGFDDSSTSDSNTAITSSTFSNFSGSTDKAYKSQYGGLKLGSSKGGGKITSKSLDLSSAFTVTLDASAYGTDASNIVVKVYNAAGTELASNTLLSGDFGTGKSLSFSAATSTSTIEISSTKRAYIDNVIVTSGSGSSTTTYSGYTTLCYEKYERTFNNVEDYATLCLPYSVNVLYLQGATAYSVAGKYVNNSTITGILLNEEETELAAGQSYVIQSTALTMNAWYSPRVDSLKAPVDTQGMVGNLSGKKIYVPVGCYGLSHNKLRKVASENTASIDHYKAYFVLNDDVPVVDSSVLLPGSKVMRTTDDEATALDESAGQPAINWNEPVYNILGIRVGKDATGVLIQNGIKYLR